MYQTSPCLHRKRGRLLVGMLPLISGTCVQLDFLKMQTAFGFRFSQPAAAPAFALDRAMGAADGGVAFGDQGMERELVFGDSSG